MGNMAFMQGDYASARSLYEESLVISQQLGSKGGIAETLSNLGHLAHRQGNVAGARQLYIESLRISREIGARQSIAIALAGLGAVTCSARQPVNGVRLLGAAQALLEAMGAVEDPVNRAEYEHGVAAARAQLDEEAFATGWAEGRAMSMDQAIEYALQEIVFTTPG
jgi:tetratricopeptide (TPR) repeat protein